MRIKRAFLLFATALVFMGAARCSHGFKPDLALAATEAGDLTAIIRVQGCGRQPFVSEGYTYCRLPEGSPGAMAIEMVAPPMAINCADPCADGTKKCSNPSCVSFTIFFPTGAPPYSDTIPLGQVSKLIKWKDLTGKDTVSINDRGFWPYTYTIRYLDDQKLPRTTVSEGEIRMRVYRESKCETGGTNLCTQYLPLHDAPNDPNFVWAWTMDGQEIKMTTGARTYAAPAPGGK